jgi:hypothetical protein
LTNAAFLLEDGKDKVKQFFSQIFENNCISLPQSGYIRSKALPVLHLMGINEVKTNSKKKQNV